MRFSGDSVEYLRLFFEAVIANPRIEGLCMDGLYRGPYPLLELLALLLRTTTSLQELDTPIVDNSLVNEAFRLNTINHPRISGDVFRSFKNSPYQLTTLKLVVHGDHAPLARFHEALCSFVKTAICLETLDLTGIDFCKENMIPFVNALASRHSPISTLSVSWCTFDTEATEIWTIFMQMGQSTKPLEHVVGGCD